jgi:hypothetical protein
MNPLEKLVPGERLESKKQYPTRKEMTDIGIGIGYNLGRSEILQALKGKVIPLDDVKVEELGIEVDKAVQEYNQRFPALTVAPICKADYIAQALKSYLKKKAGLL